MSQKKKIEGENIEQVLKHSLIQSSTSKISIAQRTREANPAGENSAFIHTCNVLTVPPYHFLGSSLSDCERMFRNPMLK